MSVRKHRSRPIDIGQLDRLWVGLLVRCMVTISFRRRPHLLLTLLLCSLSSLTSVLSHCNTILRLHKVYDGVGVFAERTFHEGEIIAIEPMVSIHMNFSERSMIDYYAFSSWDTPKYDNLIFGNALVLNHHPQPNLIYSRAIMPLESPSDFIRYAFVATREIPKGAELFISYGTDLWFTHRNIEMVSPPHDPDPSEMPRIPGCVRSTIFFSKGHRYTTEKIYAGEVIEVNRAIVIPGHAAIGNDLEEYVWFREGYNNAKGALLIIGGGALFNTSSDDPDSANVMYSWYNPAIDSTRPEDHRVDVTCSLSMMVMFVALRDIEANERLTLPLIRDSTPLTIRQDGEEILRPKPRVYRPVKRKMVYDDYLPGDCF